ncbi:MAG: F0F1 ATP synthase subunit delta [Patescibacteria group bacterium]|nr:F0F1 ATP synthase subunit delta [Patescibacteria group bacterium]
MTITARKYAVALCELVEESSREKMATEKISRNFIDLLRKHHQLKNLQFIINYVEEYYSSNENFSLKAFVKYAGLNPKEKIEKIIQTRNPQQQILVSSKKDSKLLGGTKLIFRHHLIDSSISSVLKKLKENLRNN